MSESESTTKIKVDEDLRFGSFANAFRVVEEVGPDCFLDFMVYSAVEDEATVVSRVRVRRDFIPAIRNKMRDAMRDFGDHPPEDSTVAYRKTKERLH
jgi:hypothetical protein